MKAGDEPFKSDPLKMEEALNEIEAFNAALLNFAPYPILITNLDGSVRYVNPALETLSGYSSAEVIGLKPPFPWWPPEIGLKYRMTSRNFLKTDIFEAERRFIRKNGETFWVLLNVKEVIVNGQPRFYLSNWVDVTERKKAEDQIKKNEQQLREILNAMTEGVAMISPDLKVIQANRAEYQIMGRDPTKITLKDYFRSRFFTHISAKGIPVPLSKSPVVMAIKKKRPVLNFEEGLLQEDGSIKWLNVSAVPITDDSGEVISVVRTIIDITEQKRLREEGEQFTKKLLEAQEEERKRISRELHDDTAQYLSLLTLEISSLIDKEQAIGSPNVPRLEKFLGTAEKALQEVRRFSHELRPNILEQVGLASAIELIVNEFNGVCGTAVVFKCSDREIRLPEEIELALFRITQEALNNIRKHSEAKKAEVLLRYNLGQIHLKISDNGKGFLISPFPGSRQKGGLGLIGMRERANLIGAKLKLKSQPGKGTVISVALALKKMGNTDPNIFSTGTK